MSALPVTTGLLPMPNDPDRISEEAARATAKQVPVRLLVGGLYLLTTPEAEIDRLVRALREEWRIGEIAPGHCTGERAFASLQGAFGRRYRYAGVGTVIELP